MQDAIFNDNMFEFKPSLITPNRPWDMRVKNGIFRFWYIEQGTAKLICDHCTITASAGDMLFIPQEFPCHAETHGDEWVRMTMLGFRYFPNTDKYDYPPQLIRMDQELLRFFREITISPNITTTIIWTFYRFLHIATKRMVRTDQKKLKKIERALEYMNAHDNYDVPTLARLCKLSESRFYALFTELVGTTPIEDKHRRQMMKAEILLKTTELSIDEIARKVGFASTQYFRKIFKKRYDTTPYQIRKNNRQGRFI